MSDTIKKFEQATEEFMSNPSQETFETYINEFANAIYNKVEVQAMVMFEEVNGVGPCMRLNRMSTEGMDFY